MKVKFSNEKKHNFGKYKDHLQELYEVAKTDN